MVGLAASGGKSCSRPGRVATPPELKTTSWQSGETPCGRSAGAMSETRPEKISMGASKEPRVVIEESRQSKVGKSKVKENDAPDAMLSGVSSKKFRWREIAAFLSRTSLPFLAL